MPGRSEDQDPQEDTDLEDTESDDQEDLDGDADVDDGSADDHEPEGNDLRGMSQEQLVAEAVKLRREAANKRIKLREARDKVKALEQTHADKDLQTRNTALENENATLRATNAGLTVGNALRDYLTEHHPQHIKLSKRIARFVETDGLDIEDEDEVQEAVKKAADEFIADLPPVSGNGNGSGQPIGGIGRVPGRNAANDTAAKLRQKEAIPEAYKVG